MVVRPFDPRRPITGEAGSGVGRGPKREGLHITLHPEDIEVLERLGAGSAVRAARQILVAHIAMQRVEDLLNT